MEASDYYQETLAKWQDIAAGRSIDTGRECGFCRFTDRIGPRLCSGCPVLEVWPDVESCDELLEVAVAHDARRSGDDEALKKVAAKVVELLEANKDALLAAMEVDK